MFNDNFAFDSITGKDICPTYFEERYSKEHVRHIFRYSFEGGDCKLIISSRIRHYDILLTLETETDSKDGVVRVEADMTREKDPDIEEFHAVGRIILYLYKDFSWPLNDIVYSFWELWADLRAPSSEEEGGEDEGSS